MDRLLKINAEETMITQEMIDRINTLYHKSPAVGLT